MNEYLYKTNARIVQKFKDASSYFLIFTVALLFPSVASAHCPLCTAGAGILAVLAASMGVPATIIAVMLGGFAMALGLWFSRVVKKKYFRFQDQVVIWGAYLLTVVPLWPVLKEYKALYVPWLGIDKYATTIPVDVYILGVILGGLVLLVSPYLSGRVTKWAGKQIIPFQGVVITLVLLVLVPLIVDIFFLT